MYPKQFSESQSLQFRANMDSEVQLFYSADQSIDELHAATLAAETVN